MVGNIVIKFFYIFIFLFVLFLFMYPRDLEYSYPSDLVIEFDVGMDEINQNNFSRAIELLVPVAEAGHREAPYWIGFAHRYSSFPVGSPYDEKIWYQRGAKAGDPYAMLALGVRKYDACYRFEQCSLWDYYWKWKANVLLSSRSNNNDAQAQLYKLLYLDDPSYDENNDKELNYFLSKLKLIAENGDQRAVVNYYLKSNKYLEGDGSLSILKAQAEQAGGLAAFYLGKHYRDLAEDNIDKLKNYEASIFWLSKAADEGVDSAIYSLVGMYEAQPELNEYVEQLYYYCRIFYEDGGVDEWCSPTSNKNYQINITKIKRKELNMKAREWMSKKFISRNYKPLDGFSF